LARDLIGRTRVARLLHGFRDVAPANMDAIETALINLAALTADIPQIVSLDVNPLLADAEGVIALDARIQVGERPAGARTAIHPYPAALARHADVEGREYLLRPIRPDDEAALVDMAARSSPEDLRLRFFGPMRELSHKIAARLCQLDYDREMAFVAIEPNHDNQAVVGVAHLIIDPNFERADFAVMVRTDYKKHGLGYALMQGLFQYAQSRGVGVVSGDVLASNEAMLHLARALGATLERHPEDVAIMKATFRLPAVARPAGSSPLAAAGAA
jgi:acetyltransferase